jgi:hypothetical protein
VITRCSQSKSAHLRANNSDSWITVPATITVIVRYGSTRCSMRSPISSDERTRARSTGFPPGNFKPLTGLRSRSSNSTFHRPQKLTRVITCAGKCTTSFKGRMSPWNFRFALGDLAKQPQDHHPSHLLQFARDQHGFVIAPFPHGRARTSLPYGTSLETSSHCFSVSGSPGFPSGENYILSSSNPPRTSSLRGRR